MAITGDPLPYGIAPNRKVIEELIGHALTQGIITKPVTVDELFAPSTRGLVAGGTSENAEILSRSARALTERRNSATVRIVARARFGENVAHRVGRGSRAVRVGERSAQTAQLLVARQRIPFADVVLGWGRRGHHINDLVNRILHAGIIAQVGGHWQGKPLCNCGMISIP